MGSLPSGFPAQLPGGIQSSLAISAPAVVKAGPGILNCLSPAAASTTVTINDAATLAAANASNVIFESPLTSMQKGDWPSTRGIVVSAVAGAVSVAFT